MGLTKPSGGGGANAELIFSNCATKVGSFGIQFAHHNAAARFCDPSHLPGDVEGLGSKHGAEDGQGQIERIVLNLLQVARISLLELQAVETRLRRALVPGLHEVAGYVDSNNFSS
jgi:hypothetical protein